jgi:hypothetical protein
MKKIFFLLSMSISDNKNTIKNIELPSCKNCIHFTYSSPSMIEYGKCSKFGEKNLITDEINNMDASSCRNDNQKCGIEGKYFEEKNSVNKIIENVFNFTNNLSFITFFLTLLYSLMVFYKK